jgi:hypothetical protein
MEFKRQFRFDRSTDNAINKIIAHLAQEGLEATASNAIRWSIHKVARKLKAVPFVSPEVE